ncbi:hypothetical protein GUJ93_ZPchr0002g23595 [Zizania palustris]|uniref:Uncharacterized protein n=1 Tax=Zizania palustris TaxID=103762 RepID=A0A8J5VC82_ZIZPA|nr:hypothetical protein GUJ93_ZPchr0002g23595 [Zizania palustris]
MGAQKLFCRVFCTVPETLNPTFEEMPSIGGVEFLSFLVGASLAFAASTAEHSQLQPDHGGRMAGASSWFLRFEISIRPSLKTSRLKHSFLQLEAAEVLHTAG